MDRSVFIPDQGFITDPSWTNSINGLRFSPNLFTLLFLASFEKCVCAPFGRVPIINCKLCLFPGSPVCHFELKSVLNNLNTSSL